MAVTQNTYTGNGSTVLYSFTFPYLETTDIKVSLNGTVTTAYTLANATTIQFNTAPANGAAIRIYRQTDDAALAAQFYPGSAIRSQDLNENFTQNLYVTQESNRDASAAVSTANSATTTSNSALTAANTAVSTSTSALSQSTTALSNSATALTNSATALSTANSAVTTANSADAKATTALDTLANTFQYTPIANVAAIPSTPADQEAVEVADTTGIESFTPLTGLPGGFVGDSGLRLRIQYFTSNSHWNYLQYVPNDPEARYLNTSGNDTTTGTLTAASFIPTSSTVPTNGVYLPAANSVAIASNGTGRLFVDSSGKVGVGRFSEVTFGVYDNNAYGIEMGYTPPYGGAYLQGYNRNVGGGSIDLLYYLDGTANHRFFTGANERLRITSGRLLVGTSYSIDADSLIQAYKTSGSSNCYIGSGSASNGETSKIILRHSAPYTRNAELGVYKNSARLESCAFANLQQANGTDIYYWTDDSSNLRSSSTLGHIGTASGTVVGTQTSDERLKNILGAVEYGLDTLKQIEPVRYSLKSEPETTKLGFIAQQVQPLIPESVFDTGEHIGGEPEDAPTKLGMEYVSLVPVLVNAIKELSAEVDALKAQLLA